MSLPKLTDYRPSLFVSIQAVLLVLFALSDAAAQVPNRMQYQLSVVDTDGKVLFDEDVRLRMSILYDTLDNTVIFRELHEVNSGTDGFIRIMLGSGESVTGSLQSLPWAEGPFFLKTELAYGSETEYRTVGLTEFASVPFALYSNIAYDLVGGEPQIPDGGTRGDLLFQKDSDWMVLPTGEAGKSLGVNAAGNISWMELVTESAEAQALNLEAQMVYISGGAFTMGCTTDQGAACGPDETPTQMVTVSDFYLSKYEVTQALWQSVMGDNPSVFAGCAACPVETVSWNAVQEFLSRLNALTGLNYRLPTEAEWEYAARGGKNASTFLYAGSDSPADVAWYSENSGDSTRVVGQKLPNALGIYDLSGNVSEWCLDWYVDDYTNISDNLNPQGPATGSARIRRGGNWNSIATMLRTAGRDASDPGVASDVTGLRLARSVN